MTDIAQAGRRQRNSQEKRERIFHAAAQLLDTHGFAAVTPSRSQNAPTSVPERCFRYARSKSELLLMVFNERFATSVRAGEAMVAHTHLPAEKAHALIAPTFVYALRNGENSVAYQRELLFGSHSGRYRFEGLALVSRLKSSLAESLRAAVPPSVDAEEASTRARIAGMSIFAAMQFAIAGLSTGMREHTDPKDDLEMQIAQIVAWVSSAPSPLLHRRLSSKADRSDIPKEEKDENDD